MSAHELRRAVRVYLEKEMESDITHLVDGKASDYADYQGRAARIKTMREVVGVMDEEYRRLNDIPAGDTLT